MGGRGASAVSIKTSFSSYSEVAKTLDANGEKIKDNASDGVLLKAYAQARALSSGLDGGSQQIRATNQAREASDILMTRERKDNGRDIMLKLTQIDMRYGVSGVKDYDAPSLGGGLDLYREATKKL